MSEQPGSEPSEIPAESEVGPQAEPVVEAPGRTGVARVDAVVETLERLEELPLEEHVGVLEAAHGELRRALDANPTHEAMSRIAGAGS